MKNPITTWLDNKIKQAVEVPLKKVAEQDVKVRAMLDRKGYADAEHQYSFKYREEYLELYRKYVWVFKAVNVIANSAASVPLRMWNLKANQQRGDEVLDGRIWNLFNRPNPFMSYFDLIEASMASLELTGQNYIEKGGPDPLNPIQLYVLRPDWVEIIPDAHRLIAGYEYTVNGQVIRFTDKEVCYIKYYHPLSELYGMSASEPAMNSLILDMYTIKYQKNFFKQGGMINTYIKVPKSLSDNEFQRFKEQVNTMHGGVDRAHILGVFDSDAEIKELGTDPQKILLKDQRLMNRDEVLAAFGVPPIMVGLLDSATFNNSQEQKIAFWENTMTPKLQKLQDKFNQEFFYPLNMECAFDKDKVPALQKAKQSTADTATKLVSGGIYTPNEARSEFFNKEAKDGGDTLQTGASAYPVEATPTVDTTTPIIEGAPATAGIAENVTALNGAQISSAIQVIQEVIAGRIPKVAGTELIVAVGIPRDRAEQMINESSKLPVPAETPIVKRSKTADFDRASVKHMPKYYQVMKNVFGQMEKSVLSKVKNKHKTLGLKKNDMVNAAFNDLDAETIGLMDDLVSLHEDVAYEEYNKEYIKNKKTAVPAKIKKSAKEAIKKQAESWAKKSKDSIVKTMKDRVSSFMDEAIKSDMSIEDVTDGVETIFEGTERGEYPHARMIARTETSRAINSGKFYGMQDSGMPYKQWIAGGGENGRPDHVDLEELGPVPMDYVYKTDNGEILYPGDPNADVSDLVNCRCTIIPSLVGGNEDE